MLCRELEKEGLITRRQVNGKIHNFWAKKSISPVAASQAQLPRWLIGTWLTSFPPI
jgi:predicted transcriptional regulator